MTAAVMQAKVRQDAGTRNGGASLALIAKVDCKFHGIGKSLEISSNLHQQGRVYTWSCFKQTKGRLKKIFNLIESPSALNMVLEMNTPLVNYSLPLPRKELGRTAQ